MLEIKLGILKSGLCGLHRSADSGDARDFWPGVMLYDYPDPGRCSNEAYGGLSTDAFIKVD